jgi:hypothetical protein
MMRKLEERSELERTGKLAVPVALAKVREAFVQVPKRRQALAGEELLFGVGCVRHNVGRAVCDDQDVLEHILVLRFGWTVNKTQP